MTSRSRYRLFAVSIFLAGIACLNVAHAEDAATAYSVTSGGDSATIIFSGVISPASAQSFFDALRPETQILKITSQGGDAIAGIRIGDEVSRRGMTVIVDGYCASSCANFVFLAAKTKVLVPGSILGFHGGVGAAASREAESPAATEGDRAMRKIGDEIFRFYDRHAISSALIQHSHELTKLDQPKTTIDIVSIDGKHTEFSLDQSDEAAHFMVELSRANNFKSMSAVMRAVSANKIYFPSREALRDYGVEGIEQYAYPSSEEELNVWAARLFGAEIEVVGDFR